MLELGMVAVVFLQPIPAANFTASFAAWITTGGVTYANNFYCAEG